MIVLWPLDLLRNSQIAAEGILPMCQDTGTAIIMAKKGRCVWTDGGDEGILSEGIEKNLCLRQPEVFPACPPSNV